jgi:hypothetical protein
MQGGIMASFKHDYFTGMLQEQLDNDKEDPNPDVENDIKNCKW